MERNEREVQLTKRDLEIIRFINEFGFCEMSQLEKFFSLRRPLSYRLMRRLIKAGLVLHRRIFHSTYGIYYLTANGAKCTELPSMGAIVLGRYEHQRMVTNVYIKLKEKFPDTEWLSERRLKHEKYYA